MRQLLHILLAAVVLSCPYVCCPTVEAADESSACCCHCAHGKQSAGEKQAPSSPSPCQAGDCLCRGAVLSQPVEMQLDLALPMALFPTAEITTPSADQSSTLWSENICTASSGPWSSGRELRLVIDSLLI